MGAFILKDEKSGFFLVREEILPEAIKKTIRVKEMLKRGDARTINEAVEKMDLSRSAYYKYKDYVFPFYEASKNKIVTLTFLLEHKRGVLSSVLNTISGDSGSVLTINQGIPLQGFRDNRKRYSHRRHGNGRCSAGHHQPCIRWKGPAAQALEPEQPEARRCPGTHRS